MLPLDVPVVDGPKMGTWVLETGHAARDRCVQFKLNFLIPSLDSDHELGYVLPYITYGVKTTLSATMLF